MTSQNYLSLISKSAFEDYVADFLGRADMATLDLIIRRHLVFRIDKEKGLYVQPYGDITIKELRWINKVLERYMKKYPFWECLLTCTEIH